MGANVSQEVMAAANESINIINSQTQNCVTQGSQSQVIEACSAKGCGSNSSITVNYADFTQQSVYTTECSADINITSDVTNQINMAFMQEAQSIAQMFQLSVANVDQVTKIAATIATSIDNTTVQNCIDQITQQQAINLGCVPGEQGFCNIVINETSLRQGFDPINDCVLQESNAQTVINEVSQMIQQQGTSKVESIFGPLFTIIFIIIIIIFAVLFGGVKALTNWRLWIVVIVVVLIYLALAFWRHWFPFETKST